MREGEIVTSEHIRILRDLALIDNQGTGCSSFSA